MKFCLLELKSNERRSSEAVILPSLLCPFSCAFNSLLSISRNINNNNDQFRFVAPSQAFVRVRRAAQRESDVSPIAFFAFDVFINVHQILQIPASSSRSQPVGSLAPALPAPTEIAQVQPQADRVRRVIQSGNLDYQILQEIEKIKPFAATYGNFQQAWDAVADAVNATKKAAIDDGKMVAIKARYAKERFEDLVQKQRDKDDAASRQTGLGGDPESAKDVLLVSLVQEIISVWTMLPFFIFDLFV